MSSIIPSSRGARAYESESDIDRPCFAPLVDSPSFLLRIDISRPSVLDDAKKIGAF
jgi:hypothetical protein